MAVTSGLPSLPSGSFPAFDSPSRSGSQTSSPSSPTSSFVNQQQQVYSSVRQSSSLSPYSSLPGTPTTATNGSGLLDPPSSMSFADFMRTWSDTHVARWLSDNKLGHLAHAFKTHDIRSDVLLDLNQATLKEMGISSVGERIRILNAMKSLRQKCVQSNASKPVLSIHAEYDDSSANHSSRETSPAGRRRLEAGRPAPLQLLSHSARNDLPRLIREGQDSARAESSRQDFSRTPGSSVRPLPQPTHGGPSSNAQYPHSPHSSYLQSTRPNLPPLPAPPRGPPPLPPTGRSRTTSTSAVNGRKTPTQGESGSHHHQPLSTAAPQPQGLLTPTGPSGSWSGYGLPSDPRPGNAGSRTPARSDSPLSSQRLVRSPATPALVHGRNSSLSSLNPQNSSTAKLAQRPSTGQGSYPFTTPTLQGAFLTSAQQLANLSPVAESFINRSSSSPSPPTPSSYRVGSGPFPRPTTPSVPTPTLDALMRKLVRFQLPDASQSCTINAEECAGGIEILEKALKKLKIGTRSPDKDGLIDYIGSNDGGLSVDGWGVYLDWGQGDNSSTKPLTEAQLLAICHASPEDHVRGHVLIVKRIGRAKRSKALHQIFGEEPPIPPTPNLVYEENDDFSSSPRYNRPFATDQAQLENANKRAKRASTISVLSGLGVHDPEAIPDSYLASPSHPSPGKSSANMRKGPSKLRNFFGQRPPSELITNHLAEYFPFTEKKVLERTRRQSMMRASGMGPGRRDSIVSWNAPATSRFSVSSQGSHRPISTVSSRTSFSSLAADRVPFPPTQAEDATSVHEQSDTAFEEPPPRVSISTDDGSEIDTNGDESDAQPYSTAIKRMSKLHLLPPVKFPSESLSESMNDLTGDGFDDTIGQTISKTSSISKRMSLITELRSKRDRSDAASLMTVDEITAEVESRRETGLPSEKESPDEWTKVDFEDESKIASGMEKETPLEPEDIPVAVAENDTDVEEEDDDMDYIVDEEEAEDELTDGDEPGKAITSQHGERTIKWIKGALIGAGSFGQVYLGMDASTGLLMAVKQVSLPTSGVNQERKKSMLSALEREIELLKDLQHENIVQYHTSCIDDEHLNIFLEYVPGGSVTALLRNYGAFEEQLVRNFVRQILQGLNYLHERDIIHRDIKGANILVDNKGGIKISDFGISKKVEDNLLHGARAHRPSFQGSVYWMAPEVVKQTAYTRKADIWSVGCLVVEMLTGEHPWAQLNQTQAIFKIGSSAKPTIPSDISPEAKHFLQLTFELNHEARPDAGELLQHAWITGTK